VIFIISVRTLIPLPVKFVKGFYDPNDLNDLNGQRSTRVASITIFIGPSFFMAVDTPRHEVSIDHLDRPLFYTCQTMADGTIHLPLNMNPMRKNNKSGKLVHSLPLNFSPRLNIFYDFKRFWPFADRIRGVASSTELNIGNPCRPIPLCISMAEGAVQIDCLFVMDMIEENGLVDRGPRENRKDGEEDTFCLDPKSMVGNDSKKEKEDNNDENGNGLSHISF